MAKEGAGKPFQLAYGKSPDKKVTQVIVKSKMQRYEVVKVERQMLKRKWMQTNIPDYAWFEVMERPIKR